MRRLDYSSVLDGSVWMITWCRNTPQNSNDRVMLDEGESHFCEDPWPIFPPKLRVMDAQVKMLVIALFRKHLKWQSTNSSTRNKLCMSPSSEPVIAHYTKYKLIFNDVNVFKRAGAGIYVVQSEWSFCWDFSCCRVRTTYRTFLVPYTKTTGQI